MEGTSSASRLQQRVDALLALTDEPGASEHGAPAFSPFVGDGAARAGDLEAAMRRAAEENGLEAALAVAERAAEIEPSGLVKRSVKVFVTHEPLAIGRLELPLVEVVSSELVEEPVRPSHPPPGGALPPGIPGAPPRAEDPPSAPRVEAAPPPEDTPDSVDLQDVPSLTEPPAERALDWYREDPFANDHHAHWHVVYRRDGGGPLPIQPRHGELFLYMHRQMLARYDTERKIAGLGSVEPHPPADAQGRPDYAATIPEGYGSAGYTRRRAGRSFDEISGAVDRCRAAHRRLQAVIAAGRLDLGPDVDLGALTESQLGAASEGAALNTGAGVIDVRTIDGIFGNLHGSGHGNAGLLGEGPNPRGWGGVMNWTETAICDPFFYRWHKHVDDVYDAFQEASGETNDPAEFAPPDVSFGDGRSLALCLSREIAGADATGFDFDGFARERLGDDLGDPDGLLTGELLTRFMRSRVTAGIPLERDRVSFRTTHLTHEPFTYFVRLENAASESRVVTLRTFLAHAELAEDRRCWIELDKFEATLAPGINVLGRPDARSSVIKRRGVTAPGAEPLADGAADQWCDCGWPYSLLLPSGDGDEPTRFKLMVAVTDNTLDREPDHIRTCGSMSYCGALENYPDRRRMGYPFDRPLAGGSIGEAIDAAPSMARMELAIRCETGRPQ